MHSKSQAATLEVCSTCRWTTVTAAIQAAKAGDRILVKKGLYQEGQITVDKPLHLIGEGFPILDGKNETEILTVMADGVIVEGFQVQNVGTDYLEDRAGIRVRKSRDFVIRNNKLYNTFFGIYLEHSKYGVVEGNELVGKAVDEMSSGNAIHVWYSKGILVTGNQVRNHRDGIYFEFVDSSKVRDNLSEDNLRYGLHFMFSNDDDYSDNIFRRNGAGVAVMFSKRVNMWDNRFEHNWGVSSYGLLLKEIYDAEIWNNIFKENSIAIFLEGATRINYHHNDFIQNGWAIKMSGGCLTNKVYDNNFIGNTFDLSVSSHVNDNTFDHNYWSEYTGYDLDRDGIGDIPFRPMKLFGYVVNQTPEAIILLRSTFVDLINFSEKVSPIFTPTNVFDNEPLMKRLVFEKIILND